MLDTNTASYVIKGNPSSVRERMLTVPMASLCISAITEAELLHEVARIPEAKNLSMAVRELIFSLGTVMLQKLMRRSGTIMKKMASLSAQWIC